MPGVDILAQLGATQWITTDATGLQRALQRARFDLMGLASRRALSGDLAAGNAEVKSLLDAVPQMRGWAVINPAYPERSTEQMRRYVSNPRWFGAMLHPGLGGESLTSAGCKEVINAYRRYTKPLLVIVPNETVVRELEELALEFNAMKFIAAGAGYNHWQDCVLAAKRAVNIYLEPFSGGTHRGKLEAILEILGPHRILFGSNYPEHNPGAALGLLLDAKMSDAERQGILAGNAIKLFGLSRQPAEE
jgi:uncharacterized protein